MNKSKPTWTVGICTTTPHKISFFQEFEKTEIDKQKYTSNKKDDHLWIVCHYNYSWFIVRWVQCLVQCRDVNVNESNVWIKLNRWNYLHVRRNIHALYVIIPQSDIRGVQFQENQRATCKKNEGKTATSKSVIARVEKSAVSLHFKRAEFASNSYSTWTIITFKSFCFVSSVLFVAFFIRL